MRATFDSLNYKTTITTTDPAYASGDQIGSAVQIDNMCTDVGGTGTLLSVTLVSNILTGFDFNIFFFNQNPTLSGSDNAAFNMTDANAQDQFLGHIAFSSGDFVTSSSSSFITKTAIGLGLKSASSTGRDVYAVLVSRGSPDFAAGAELAVRFHIQRD